MNKEKQRIAIALAHTGTRYQWLEAEELFFRVNANDSLTQETPKDYLNDLNAMHEAEKIFETDRRSSGFCDHLHVVILTRAGLRPRGHCGIWRMICAPADVRAEAFLKTIGKWVD